MASPTTSLYAPLSPQTSYCDDYTHDPYRAISDDARRLKHARQHMRNNRQAALDALAGARRAALMASTTPPSLVDSDAEDESEDEELQDAFEYDDYATHSSLSMRRIGSSSSSHSHSNKRRTRTLSSDASSSPTIAFASRPPSSPSSFRHQQLPSSHYYSSYAPEDDGWYSPPDPSSPFTSPAMLPEELEYATSTMPAAPQPQSSNKLKKRVVRLGTFSKDTAEEKRRPSIELVMPTSRVRSHSVDSELLEPTSVSYVSESSSAPSSPLDSARRQWALLSLRVSLRMYHAKQNWAARKASKSPTGSRRPSLSA